MNRIPWLPLIALTAFILACVIGVWFQGHFLHQVLALSAAMYVGVPWVLVMLIWGLMTWRNSDGLPDGLLRIFYGFIITAGAVLLSLAVGLALHDRQVQAARAYVGGLVPVLDAYKAEHGRYPEDMARLPHPPAPPRLMARAGSYSLTESGDFRFEYWDPAGLMDGWSFESSTRQWSYFD